MTATDDEIGKGRHGRLWSFTDRSSAMPWSGTPHLWATVPVCSRISNAYLQSREYDLAQTILRALENVEIAAPRS